MLTDTRIVARHGAFDVLADCARVDFKDGSAATLHAVLAHGHPDTYLRAALDAHQHWTVFDVRRLARTIGYDVPLLPRADAPGCIAFSLRATFPSAQAMLAEAMFHRRDSWRHDAAAAQATAHAALGVRAGNATARRAITITTSGAPC